MTDIKKAQAALDGFKHISCETTAIEWFEKYAGNINFNKNIVKKALKAYIEHEQGWRFDIINTPETDEYVAVFESDISGKEITVVVKNAEDGYKLSDGYDVDYSWTMVKWMPLPPTPSEQEGV